MVVVPRRNRFRRGWIRNERSPDVVLRRRCARLRGCDHYTQARTDACTASDLKIRREHDTRAYLQLHSCQHLPLTELRRIS